MEPEGIEPEDYGDDLGVAALDEKVNRLLQEMDEEAPLPMLAFTSEGLRENNGNPPPGATMRAGRRSLQRVRSDLLTDIRRRLLVQCTHGISATAPCNTAF